MRKKQRSDFLQGYEELLNLFNEINVNDEQKIIVKTIKNKFDLFRKCIEKENQKQNKNINSISEYKNKEYIRNKEITKLYEKCKEINIIADIDLKYTDCDKTCFSDIEKMLKNYIDYKKLKQDNKTIKMDSFIISLLKEKHKYKEFIEIVGKNYENFKHQRILTLCKFLI